MSKDFLTKISEDRFLSILSDSNDDPLLYDFIKVMLNNTENKMESNLLNYFINQLNSLNTVTIKIWKVIMKNIESDNLLLLKQYVKESGRLSDELKNNSIEIYNELSS